MGGGRRCEGGEERGDRGGGEVASIEVVSGGEGGT